MAAWTGLDTRGPQAGFACVFPDGCGKLWDDLGAGRRDGLDDAVFVSAVVQRLIDDGIAADHAPLLVGLSNGAFFAERVARQGLLAVGGLVLVAGSARVAVREPYPCPLVPMAVLCIAGSADRFVPYGGGSATGWPAWMARRRARKVLLNTRGREVVPVERVARDWAAANGCDGSPVIEVAPSRAPDPEVQRLSWKRVGRPPVIVYRIIGGGHGWPGGPSLPKLVFGQIPRNLDATAIVLEFARQQPATAG
jgi:polyhydroxybutyrate depolymerase